MKVYLESLDGLRKLYDLGDSKGILTVRTVIANHQVRQETGMVCDHRNYDRTMRTYRGKIVFLERMK